MEDTCYRIPAPGRINYGGIYTYLTPGAFDKYTKCTFYGAEADIEISDADFEAVLSMEEEEGDESNVG